MKKTRKVLGAAAILLGVMLMGAAPVSAHDINVNATGVCVSSTAADITFTFSNFGSESRFVKVYLAGNLVGDFEALAGDGTHVLHLTGLSPQTGLDSFTWDTDTVTPNGKPNISIDFAPCQPVTTTGATTTGATTTMATTTTECQEGCETTTTGATTTAATTTQVTTTTMATTTTAATTTVPVTNPCPGSGCPTTTAATTTVGSTTTVASTTTTAAATTTVPDTSAVDQTLAPVPAPVPEVVPTMPVTGSTSLPMLEVGAGLFLAGSALMWSARKRAA